MLGKCMVKRGSRDNGEILILLYPQSALYSYIISGWSSLIEFSRHVYSSWYLLQSCAMEFALSSPKCSASALAVDAVDSNVPYRSKATRISDILAAETLLWKGVRFEKASSRAQHRELPVFIPCCPISHRHGG